MPSPAGFRISDSKKFALLINSTGALCVVWSKQYGHFMIKEAVKRQLINLEDVSRLRELVSFSELPTLDTDVPRKLIEGVLAVTISQLIVGPDVELSEEFILKEMESVEKQVASLSN